MFSLMVVLAVICVGSVCATDYDNLTSDSQDMLATTDSIGVSQEEIEIDENDVLEASDDDEVLSDYNYDNYGGKSYYYDDSISGTILNSASGSAVDGSSLSVGQTVHLSLGNEQINHDFGPDSKAYLRLDGDTNSANWEYVGTYQQLYTTGVDYTLKTGGSHYYQLLMNTFNNLENGAYTRFARGVYLENVVGPNIPSYSSDYSLSTDKSTVNLGEEFTITFKGNDGTFWGGDVTFYVNGNPIGTKSLQMFSESTSITTTGTPVGTLSITAYFTGAAQYEEGWAKPVTVTVVGSGGNPSQTVLKLYLDSNKELVYGEAGTAYKLYNTLTDENGNSVYTYLAQSSDGSVTEKITIYTNGATTGQIAAGAEPQFTSGVNYGFDNYGIWTVNASYAGNSNGLSSADSNDVVIIYWDKTTTTHSLDSTSVDKGSRIKITPNVIADTSNHEVEDDGKVNIYVDNKLIATIDAGKSYDLDTSTLTVGSHNIYCVYSGYSEDYKGTSYELLKTSQSSQSSFTVKSVDVSTKTTVDVSPKEVSIGDKVTITPAVTAEGKDLGVGDGKVAIYINGVKKGETDPGVGFDYTTDETGTFTVKAEYLGKDNYLKSNSTDDSFKVNKLNATLSVNPNNTNIELGSKITLTSTLTPDDATGTISYTSDDGQTGEGLSFDYTPTSEGTHTVTVHYGGNDKYNSITQTIVVNAYKASSSIKLDDELIIKVYGQSFTVTATTENSTGNVVVRLVNKNGNVEVSGVTSQGNDVNIPVIDVGEYDLYVTTSPDANHNADTAHATVRIIPKNSTLTVDPASGDWNEEVTVNVNLGEGSEGIGTAKIYDASGNTFIKDATLNGNSISVSELAAGTYMIKVNNTVNSNYNSVYANATVTINPVVSDVEFSDITFVYGGSNSTSVVLTGASDFVAVVVGQDATILKESGKVTVSGLNVGTYDLNITTVGDENHTSVSKTHKVYVTAADSSFTVYPASGDWGSEIEVTVSLGEDSNGISKADIYDESGEKFIKSAEIRDGKVVVSGLSAGNYTVKVTNDPKDNYVESISEAKVTVNPVASDVEFSDIAFVYGGSNSTSVVLTGASDYVAVVVGQDATISKESGKVTVSGLNVGTYDLTITTVGDENHTSVSRTHKVYVTAADSSFSVSPVSGDWGSDIEVPVSLGEGSEGVASADIYDESGEKFIKSAEIRDGKVVVSGLSAGNYTVKVTNDPKGNYNVAVSEAKVTVNPVVSDVEFSDIAFVYGGSNSTSVVLTGASDFVAVVVGQDATILKESGKVTVSGLNVGTYDLTITTVGDENHTSVSKTHKVNVSPLKSSVSSNDVEVTYDGKPISIEYTSKDSVNVSYTVYDEDNKVVDEGNVKANDAIDVVSLPVGKYTINLKTIVDENHESADETYSITVNNATLDFTVNAKESTYPDNATIEVRSDVDGEYLVEVNNKTYPVEVKDGVGSVVLDQLPADTYPVSVTSNVANYDKVTKNANLTIKPKAKDVITLVENYDVNKDYLNGTNYQVRVLLNGKSIGAGKVVTIKTNGITYKCKTDKDGYARLTITLKPKKYTITAEYAGIKVSNKINVKKVLKVKNVSKKKAKKIKFKATLKYSNGKAIVGKKVTFKIKGKVYTAKTNKKGIATVTFKNLKVGKYNVKVQYCNETSKAKLTIKK